MENVSFEQFIQFSRMYESGMLSGELAVAIVDERVDICDSVDAVHVPMESGRGATFEQYCKACNMIEVGVVSRELIQAILDRKVAIQERTDIETGRPQRFDAWVAYDQPNPQDLSRMFPPYVEDDFISLVFRPVGCGLDVDRKDREVKFEYISMGRIATKDEILAEMAKQGLRPALYEELLAFGKKFPKEPLKYRIIALGSEAKTDGTVRLLASLEYKSDCCPVLRVCPLYQKERFAASCRFLAVRE